jgi:hypothetical protein
MVSKIVCIVTVSNRTRDGLDFLVTPHGKKKLKLYLNTSDDDDGDEYSLSAVS